MALQSRIWGSVPFAAMVLVECAEIGVSTISKAAMSQGMSHFVFIVYYNALGTVLLFPYFIFQRNKRAPLNCKLICRFFLLGLIGSSGKILFFAGVKYSSPTLSAALANLTPIFTFLLAIAFRMEKLDLRHPSGQAKSLGTIISVCGALIVTFYKGPAVLMASLSHSGFKNQHIHSEHSAWVFGGLLLAIQCIVSSSWNIAQVNKTSPITNLVLWCLRIILALSYFYSVFGCEKIRWNLIKIQDFTIPSLQFPRLVSYSTESVNDAEENLRELEVKISGFNSLKIRRYLSIPSKLIHCMYLVFLPNHCLSTLQPEPKPKSQILIKMGGASNRFLSLLSTTTHHLPLHLHHSFPCLLLLRLSRRSSSPSLLSRLHHSTLSCRSFQI